MTSGHFKASFGKRKGKFNDTCRCLPESMSELIILFQHSFDGAI